MSGGGRGEPWLTPASRSGSLLFPSSVKNSSLKSAFGIVFRPKTGSSGAETGCGGNFKCSFELLWCKFSSMGYNPMIAISGVNASKPLYIPISSLWRWEVETCVVVQGKKSGTIRCLILEKYGVALTLGGSTCVVAIPIFPLVFIAFTGTRVHV